MRLALWSILLAVGLSGCAINPLELGREPRFAPVGAGTWADSVEVRTAPPADPPRPRQGSLWTAGGANLFRDPRAAVVGDILTVDIAIEDKASVDSASNRSRKAQRGLGFDLGYELNFPVLTTSGDGSGTANLDGTTSTDGKGATSRKETVAFRVAAVVTDVLPNGNLIISGSQEVRVNYELRVVGVAGIVRPRDISAGNTISYEKIAEARITYGGRGRAMEVQQPGWGQQIVDMLSPM